MSALLQRLWYGDSLLCWLLWPLSILFRVVSAVRRRRQQRQAAREEVSLPVVVVGNISVGGTGKTPLLITLARSLVSVGLRPGIVSRGYGGRAPHYPLAVTPDSNPAHSGDEALLISITTGCPVVVDPERLRAVRWLEKQNICDVILSDDGLQHYRMPRTIEMAVVDGTRGLGNGHCLPAGPLREPLARLDDVNFVVVNGAASKRLRQQLNSLKTVHTMLLKPERLRRVDDHQAYSMTLRQWPGPWRVHAVAGIGHPDRFFTTLAELGFEVIPHVFPDHHDFSAADLAFGDDLPIVMTAKDAVKCRSFAAEHHWVLDVSAQVPDELIAVLLAQLSAAGVAGVKAIEPAIQPARQ